MIWLYNRKVYLKAVHCIKISFDSSVFKFLLLSLHIWCDLLLIFFLESFYTLLYWIISDLVFLRFRYFKASFYDALKLSLLIDDLKFKAHHRVFFVLWGIFFLLSCGRVWKSQMKNYCKFFWSTILRMPITSNFNVSSIYEFYSWAWILVTSKKDCKF